MSSQRSRASPTVRAASQNRISRNYADFLLSRRVQPLNLTVNVGQHVGRRRRRLLTRRTVRDIGSLIPQASARDVLPLRAPPVRELSPSTTRLLNRKRNASQHDVRGPIRSQPQASLPPSPIIIPPTPDVSPDVLLAPDTPLVTNRTPPPASDVLTTLAASRRTQVGETPQSGAVTPPPISPGGLIDARSQLRRRGVGFPATPGTDFRSQIRARRRFISSSESSLNTIPERVLTQSGSLQDVSGLAGNVVTTPPPQRSLSVPSGGSLTPVNIPDTIPTNTSGEAQLRINSDAPVTPSAASTLQSPIIQAASLPGTSDHIYSNPASSRSSLSTIIERTEPSTVRSANISRSSSEPSLLSSGPPSLASATSYEDILPAHIYDRISGSSTGSGSSLTSTSLSSAASYIDPAELAQRSIQGSTTSVIEAPQSNPVAELSERGPLQRARDRARQLQNLRGSQDLSPRHDAFGNITNNNVSAHILASRTLDNQSTNDVRSASVTNVAGVGAVDAPSAPAVLHRDTAINIEASRLRAARGADPRSRSTISGINTSGSSSLNDAFTLHAALRGLGNAPAEVTQSLPNLPREEAPLGVSNSALSGGGALPSSSTLDISPGTSGRSTPGRATPMDTSGRPGSGLLSSARGTLGNLGSAIVADQLVGGNRQSSAFAPADPIGQAIANNLAQLPSQAGLTLGPDSAAVVANVLQANARTHESGAGINSNLAGAFALSPLLPQFQGPINQFVPTFNQGLRAQGAASLLRSQFHT